MGSVNTHMYMAEVVDNKSISAPGENLLFRDFLDETVNDPVPWIFSNLIAEREQMLIYGEPKIGKSQLALQMAVAAAMGKSFLNWDNSAGRRRVVYVNFEIDEHPFMNRLADHVLAEVGLMREQPAEISSAETRVILQNKHINLVNQEIKNWLHFSNGIRSMGITREVLGVNSRNNDELSAEEHVVFKAWKETIKKLSPDFIIFDTLSKIHNVDESENIAIQQVMMLLRKLAVRMRGDGKEESIAHVIVHHTRKRSRHETRQSPDSIRGGSSIRAEVDVSLGLSGVVGKSDRSVHLEARNVGGGSFSLKFDGRRFEVSGKESDGENSGEQHTKLDRIANAFRELKVRGMSVGQLHRRVVGAANIRRKWGLAMKEFIEQEAASGSHFVKVSNEARESAKMSGPLLKNAARAGDFIWIPDDSPWMQTEWMREVMSAWEQNHPVSYESLAGSEKAGNSRGSLNSKTRLIDNGSDLGCEKEPDRRKSVRSEVPKEKKSRKRWKSRSE